MKWDAERYDTSFGFVSAHGASLLDALDPQPGERILDLGCGTGELTAAIADRGAAVLGVDGSPDMVAKARKAFPRLRFEVADGQDFTLKDLAVDSGFDAVFSNAALHWMRRDPDAVPARVHAVLRPDGGRFVAEFGGARNVETIIGAVATAVRETGREPAPIPWYFPTPGDYANRLEKAGFAVRHLDYFERPTPLDHCENGAADWVRMFGSGLLAGVPDGEHATVLTRVNEVASAELLHGDRWIADYVRLRFVAVRTAVPPFPS